MTKYVYSFKEGNKDMKELLGGKGANLAEMTGIGLPVPQGFTVTTEACSKYYEDNQKISDEIIKQIYEKLEELEQTSNKKFGNKENPLLVSVRSGARASMPGMMDTILNLGINDEVVQTLAKNNKRFAYDSYRRLIMMFADVVKGYDKSKFERVLDEYKEQKKVKTDIELDENDMEIITNKFKEIYKEIANEEFPIEPKVQLIEAIGAVFRSWETERAKIYRKMNDIPDSWGTAVNVQEMVYGNLGNNSGTGVAFTRNPATGENKLYGEYLINAQGEDVVAGIRTPEPIDRLKEQMPEIYNEFIKNAKILEQHYKDMQDMEFTIENGKLYMLQTRNGKRTAAAALKIAIDMYNEGTLTKEEALLKVEPKLLDQLLHPEFNKESLKNAEVIATGLAASPGAASGKIYFNAEDIEKHKDEKTILVRLETSPEDIQGMVYSQGILTIRGGMTSHAAVVARGMGCCCICGCGELKIDEKSKILISKNKTFKEGEYISLDSSTGKVYSGQIVTEPPKINGDFEKFMEMADSVATMEVRANADTVKDAHQAIEFGAKGIGLCRTEHMFFDEKRIFVMRQMITANSEEQRKIALDKLLPMQREDFEGLFKECHGKPVTIRYLDPPLHEFLPKEQKEIESLATSLNMSFEELNNRINSLKEVNPMMGHRGCRLGITYPEIIVMQTKAVIEAALNVINDGIAVNPEIMIPLTNDYKELEYCKKIVDETAKSIISKSNKILNYQVGTMIETPRAALMADELAKISKFFSFGTNDLTQLSYGFSRDDASKFLNVYYDKKIFEKDPFASIDQNGVGELMKIATLRGRNAREDIELGICGEHAGEPASVEFCHQIGLDYVSCSPYRIPIARLAAAQAAIKSSQK